MSDKNDGPDLKVLSISHLKKFDSLDETQQLALEGSWELAKRASIARQKILDRHAMELSPAVEELNKRGERLTGLIRALAGQFGADLGEKFSLDVNDDGSINGIKFVPKVEEEPKSDLEAKVDRLNDLADVALEGKVAEIEAKGLREEVVSELEAASA